MACERLHEGHEGGYRASRETDHRKLRVNRVDQTGLHGRDQEVLQVAV